MIHLPSLPQLSDWKSRCAINIQCKPKDALRMLSSPLVLSWFTPRTTFLSPSFTFSFLLPIWFDDVSFITNASDTSTLFLKHTSIIVDRTRGYVHSISISFTPTFLLSSSNLIWWVFTCSLASKSVHRTSNNEQNSSMKEAAESEGYCLVHHQYCLLHHQRCLWGKCGLKKAANNIKLPTTFGHTRFLLKKVQESKNCYLQVQEHFLPINYQSLEPYCTSLSQPNYYELCRKLHHVLQLALLWSSQLVQVIIYCDILHLYVLLYWCSYKAAASKNFSVLVLMHIVIKHSWLLISACGLKTRKLADQDQRFMCISVVFISALIWYFNQKHWRHSLHQATSVKGGPELNVERHFARV